MATIIFDTGNGSVDIRSESELLITLTPEDVRFIADEYRIQCAIEDIKLEGRFIQAEETPTNARNEDRNGKVISYADLRALAEDFVSRECDNDKIAEIRWGLIEDVINDYIKKETEK
jgi:hypothetical protein